ncbi:MAG: dTMP kinase [Chthoniobacterales bacterium]
MVYTTLPGFFITFEGSEGCGKSTQIVRLAQELQRNKNNGSSLREVVVLREPGSTALGEKIRSLLQYDEASFAMARETELLLFAASRAQLVQEIIRPALARGAIVLCDRFLDSTTVYQGVARALRKNDVATINHFAAGGLLPDVTILLDLKSSVGRERMRARNAENFVIDRMEQEPEAFYEDVRHGYLKLAAQQPNRFIVVDASQTSEKIAQEIMEKIEPRLVNAPLYPFT